MMDSQNHRPPLLRRKYYVDRTFQGRLVLAFGTIAIAYALLTGYSVYSIVNRVLEESLYRSHQSADDTWSRIGPSLFSTNAGLAIISLVIAVMSVLVMCAWARRALRVIELDVRAIETGKPRKKPSIGLAVWHQEADVAAENIHRRFDFLLKEADRLDEAIGAWEMADSDGDCNAKDRVLEEALALSIDTLRSNIQEFRC